MRNARIFISCGQKAERERKIGLEVEKFFKKRGFVTYLAEKVHSPEALTEHIFYFLENSEYFVFIDFKREQIHGEECRGSLFVNQEIGIATFLKIPGLGFCENGVKREGILDYQIYNAFPFEDGTEIISRLCEETKDWDPNSINELKIIYDPVSTSRNIKIGNNPAQPLSDWYHLDILNRNKIKHAFSCAGYVTEVKDLLNQKEYELPTNELVWSGIGDITVNIMGGTKRELDAFLIIHKEDHIRFHQRPLGTTNPRYSLPILPKGKYLIEYTIISSNFAKISQKFKLDFQEGLEKLEFKEVS